MERNIYIANPEIADPTKNVQKKIVFDIMVDKYVNPIDMTNAASLIMNVIQNRIAPYVPIPIEYGLPDDFFAKVSSGNNTINYDYGVIVYCLVESINTEILSIPNSDVEGLTMTIRQSDMITKDPSPKFKLGTLYSVIYLTIGDILYTNTGVSTILHEFGHALGLEHEWFNSNRDWHFVDSTIENSGKSYTSASTYSKPADPSSLMMYVHKPIDFVGNVYPQNYSLDQFDNKYSHYSQSDLDAINAIFKNLNKSPTSVKFNRSFDPGSMFVATNITINTSNYCDATSYASIIQDSTCDVSKLKLLNAKDYTEHAGNCYYNTYLYPKLCTIHDPIGVSNFDGFGIYSTTPAHLPGRSISIPSSGPQFDTLPQSQQSVNENKLPIYLIISSCIILILVINL